MKKPDTAPKLRTPGVLAEDLGQPLHFEVAIRGGARNEPLRFAETGEAEPLR